MVDIHCHILPGVDDGAESLEEALIMARMAASGGVERIIATPHCPMYGGGWSEELMLDLARHTQRLNEAVKAEEIPLTILSGAEILCTASLPELLRQGRKLTLAGSRYLLVEFFFDEELPTMDAALEYITAQGLTPVIAHPERYGAVQRLPYVTERWFEQGYIIQLNKGSIMGDLGRRAARAADWILRNGFAHVVASDGHGTLERTPQLQYVYTWLEDQVSPGYAHTLLCDNPGRIAADLPIWPGR